LLTFALAIIKYLSITNVLKTLTWVMKLKLLDEKDDLKMIYKIHIKYTSQELMIS